MTHARRLRRGWTLLAPAFFFLTLPLATRALAHDLWLIPQTYHAAPGDTLWVLVATGDRFPSSEVAIDPVRIGSCRLIDAGGEMAPDRISIIDRSLAIQVVPKTPGIAIVELTVNPRFIRLEAADFNGYLEHEGLSRILDLRKKLGQLDQPGREQYSKYAKALLRVGASDDDGWKRVLGHRLEIVPEKNPFRLKAGDPLPVRLLYNGKPLPGVQIAWGHEAAGGKVRHARTDADGRAAVRLDATGKWFVHALHMIEARDNPKIDYESFWATLTFEVPAD